MVRGAMITAVIPAYNEEQRLGAVLEVLSQTPELTQIIVVDDGSGDGTPKIVKSHSGQDPRIELISLPTNRGKGRAMVTGAESSQSDIILFIDADLIGLRPDHLTALIEPVQRDGCAMTLGLFHKDTDQARPSHRLAPFLSGQRCLRWSLFRAVPKLEATAWSIEVALSLYAWRQRYPVTLVSWPGVHHLERWHKRGRILAYGSYVKMWLDIGLYVLTCFLVNPPRLKRSQPGSHRTVWQPRSKGATHEN